jgi:hypothetical protein
MKKKRDKEYFQYLVKWKGKPLENSMWMHAIEISNYRKNIEEILEQIP